jgi:hypothetical protein
MAYAALKTINSTSQRNCSAFRYLLEARQLEPKNAGHQQKRRTATTDQNQLIVLRFSQKNYSTIIGGRPARAS